MGPRGAKGRRSAVYFREDGHGPLGPRDHARALVVLGTYLGSRAASPRRSDEATVAEVFQAYLQDRAENASPKTYKNHQERLRKWAQFVGPDRMPYGQRLAWTLSADDLLRAVQAWQRAGLAPNYVRHLGTSLKACWAWAARPVLDRQPRRLIESDPLADVRLPVSPQVPQRYSEPEIVAAFLDWMDARFRDSAGDAGRMFRRTVLLFRFIWETGCRPGEACNLQWPDLDLERRIAVLRQHKTSRRTGRLRTIPLCASLAAALTDARAEEHNHPEYVFTHRRSGRGSLQRGEKATGEPWTSRSLGFRWTKLRAQAIREGVPVPADLLLYDLRRSWLSDSYAAGFTAEQAGKATGTSARMVDRVYASMRSHQLVEMADVISERRRKGSQ